MRIEYVNSYTEDGNHITGTLAVVRYSEALHSQGIDAIRGTDKLYDYINQAKELINLHHPSNEVVLTRPDYVVKLGFDN
jgi:hypothetical protein